MDKMRFRSILNEVFKDKKIKIRRREYEFETIVEPGKCRGQLK